MKNARQVIPAAFQQQQFGVEFRVQLFERQQIRRNVLPDRRMRTAAGFHREDPLRRQGLIACQKFAILPCENVIGHAAMFIRERSAGTIAASALFPLPTGPPTPTVNARPA